MRSRVPWNVSGIPPELRDAARRAAERAGVPLEEWLQGVIAERTAGLPPSRGSRSEQGAADMSAGSYLRRDDNPWNAYSRVPGNRPRETGYGMGDPGGALTDLHRRIEETERRQFAAVEQLDRAVAAIADRLESADSLKSAADSAMRAAAEAYETSNREQTSAFESLERSVDGMVSRLEETSSKAETALAATSSLSGVQEAIDRLKGQIEQSAARAAASGGDLEKAIGAIAARLGALEKNQANALDATFADLKKQFAAAESRALESANALTASFAALSGRLNGLDERHGLFGEESAHSREVLATLEAAVGHLRSQTASAEARAHESARDLAQSLSQIADRLGTLESRHAVAAAEQDRARGLFETFEQSIASLKAQAAQSEARAGEAATTVNAALSSISERLAGFEERQASAARELKRSIDDVSAAHAGEIKALAERLNDIDGRHGAASRTVETGLAQVSGRQDGEYRALADRLSTLEARNAETARNLKETLVKLVQRWEERGADHDASAALKAQADETRSIGATIQAHANLFKTHDDALKALETRTRQQDGRLGSVDEALRAAESRLADAEERLAARLREQLANEIDALKGQEGRLSAHEKRIAELEAHAASGPLGFSDEDFDRVRRQIADEFEIYKAGLPEPADLDVLRAEFAGDIGDLKARTESFAAALRRIDELEARLTAGAPAMTGEDLDGMRRQIADEFAAFKAGLPESPDMDGLRAAFAGDIGDLKARTENFAEAVRRLDELEARVASPAAGEEIEKLRVAVADASTSLLTQAEKLDALGADLAAMKALPAPETTPDPETLGRVATIEQQLQTLAVQIGHAERRQGESASTVEQALRGVGTRVEAGEKRQRDALGAIQNQLEAALRRLEALENAPPPAPAAAPAMSVAPAAPMLAPAAFERAAKFDEAISFEPPPADEVAAPPPAADLSFEPPPAAIAEAEADQELFGAPDAAPPAFDEEAYGEEDFDDEPPFEDEDAYAPLTAGEVERNTLIEPPAQETEVEAAIAEVLGRPDEPPTRRTDDFLAAARRAAQAAAAAEADALSPRAREGRNRFDATAGEGGTNWVRLALMLSVLLALAAAAYYFLVMKPQAAPEETAPPAAADTPAPQAEPTATTPFEELPPAPPLAGEPAAQPEGTPAAPDAAPTGEVPPAADPQAGAPETPVAPDASPAPAEPVAAAPAEPAPTAAPMSRIEKLTADAEAGDPRAQFELGLRYAEGEGVKKNNKEAAKWMMRAAEQGLPPAQYRMGVMYERGLGVPRDMKQAKVWYERSANAGNRKAMYNLAVLLADGSTGKPDYKNAAKWFLAAAELGLKDSQFNIAILYERGLGVEVNLIEAYKWYAAAAAQGDTDAGARAAALEGRMPEADAAAARQAAADFKAKPMNAAANDVPSLEE